MEKLSFLKIYNILKRVNLKKLIKKNFMINNYLNKELKKFIVTPENTIKSALKKITNCGQRCVAVVSKKNNLLGTLADSDIRKALLSNPNINRSIKKYF